MINFFNFNKTSKSKPKLDFTRNKLLKRIFKEYDITYALTLDTCDYIDAKSLSLFRKYVRKDMKRSLKRMPGVSRKQIKYSNLLLRDKENVFDK